MIERNLGESAEKKPSEIQEEIPKIDRLVSKLIWMSGKICVLGSNFNALEYQGNGVVRNILFQHCFSTEIFLPCSCSLVDNRLTT